MAHTLKALAEFLNAELHGDPDCEVVKVATLVDAGPGSVTFLSNRLYHVHLKSTRASAVILQREFLSQCPVAALVMDNPYLGYAHAATIMHPLADFSGGVHPSAWVSEQATVHESAWIGPQCSVGANAVIGERVYIGPSCVIDEGATIGANCRFTARVTLCRDVTIGERGVFHPGVVVGGDGFGIANDAGKWVKVPQIGSVRIGDDVEIGANTTVDRGALEDTIVENGVKLDNQIQVAHNVRIGEHTAIAACVAIGGSTHIGRRCIIGGGAALAGHLQLADDVHLTATSAVSSSIRKPGVYSSGMPVQENRAWRRNIVRLRQLDEMAKRLKTVEEKLK